MRRPLCKASLVAIAAAAWAPAAHACDVVLSASSGQAPLTVTYTAACDSTTYRWTFADGGTADGKVVTHTFAGGRWTGSLATDANTDALAPVTAIGVSLRAPRAAAYRGAITLSGTVVPPFRRVRIYRGKSYVTTATAAANGRFRAAVRLLAPGPYTARLGRAVSPPVTVLVKPTLQTRLVGTRNVGRPLSLVARLRPAAAGAVRVRVGPNTKQGRALRIELDTRRPARLRIRVRSVAADGYLTAARVLNVSVVFPDLEVGDSGPSVRELEERLGELRYASLGADGSFGQDTADAVMAFQKVERLPRTGRADASVWARLARAKTPGPRYGAGEHVEIDKTRQVLLLVRGGKVALIVPVSTAGIAGYYTPEGRFAVYRKVRGLDPSPLGVLYDPSYFVGGYAVHGSPSVPPYPASHGCVRVPMWISWRIYSTLSYGEPVYVYS